MVRPRRFWPLGIIAVLLIWWCMLAFAGEAVYSMGSRLWRIDQLISKDLFLTANLMGVGLWKMAVMFFFAIPWLAMKIIGK